MKTKLLILSILLCCFLSEGKSQERDAAPFIRVGDYCEFLNAVAASDLDHFYDEKISLVSRGACILRFGESGNYHYEMMPGEANASISFISWNDAEAYCNWKNETSHQYSSSLEGKEDKGYTVYRLEEGASQPSHQKKYYVVANSNAENGDLSLIDPLIRLNNRHFKLIDTSVAEVSLKKEKELTFWEQMKDGVALGMMFTGGGGGKPLSGDRKKNREEVVSPLVSSEKPASFSQKSTVPSKVISISNFSNGSVEEKQFIEGMILTVANRPHSTLTSLYNRATQSWEQVTKGRNEQAIALQKSEEMYVLSQEAHRIFEKEQNKCAEKNIGNTVLSRISYGANGIGNFLNSINLTFSTVAVSFTPGGIFTSIGGGVSYLNRLLTDVPVKKALSERNRAAEAYKATANEEKEANDEIPNTIIDALNDEKKDRENESRLTMELAQDLKPPMGSLPKEKWEKWAVKIVEQLNKIGITLEEVAIARIADRGIKDPEWANQIALDAWLKRVKESQNYAQVLEDKNSPEFSHLELLRCKFIQDGKQAADKRSAVQKLQENSDTVVNQYTEIEETIKRQEGELKELLRKKEITRSDNAKRERKITTQKVSLKQAGKDKEEYRKKIQTAENEADEAEKKELQSFCEYIAEHDLFVFKIVRAKARAHSDHKALKTCWPNAILSELQRTVCPIKEPVIPVLSNAITEEKAKRENEGALTPNVPEEYPESIKAPSEDNLLRWKILDECNQFVAQALAKLNQAQIEDSNSISSKLSDLSDTSLHGMTCTFVEEALFKKEKWNKLALKKVSKEEIEKLEQQDRADMVLRSRYIQEEEKKRKKEESSNRLKARSRADELYKEYEAARNDLSYVTNILEKYLLAFQKAKDAESLANKAEEEWFSLAIPEFNKRMKDIPAEEDRSLAEEFLKENLKEEDRQENHLRCENAARSFYLENDSNDWNLLTQYEKENYNSKVIADIGNGPNIDQEKERIAKERLQETEEALSKAEKKKNSIARWVRSFFTRNYSKQELIAFMLKEAERAKREASNNFIKIVGENASRKTAIQSGRESLLPEERNKSMQKKTNTLYNDAENLCKVAEDAFADIQKAILKDDALVAAWEEVEKKAHAAKAACATAATSAGNGVIIAISEFKPGWDSICEKTKNLNDNWQGKCYHYEALKKEVLAEISLKKAEILSSKDSTFESDWEDARAKIETAQQAWREVLKFYKNNMSEASHKSHWWSTKLLECDALKASAIARTALSEAKNTNWQENTNFKRVWDNAHKKVEAAQKAWNKTISSATTGKNEFHNNNEWQDYHQKTKNKKQEWDAISELKDTGSKQISETLKLKDAFLEVKKLWDSFDKTAKDFIKEPGILNLNAADRCTPWVSYGWNYFPSQEAALIEQLEKMFGMEDPIYRTVEKAYTARYFAHKASMGHPFRWDRIPAVEKAQEKANIAHQYAEQVSSSIWKTEMAWAVSAAEKAAVFAKAINKWQTN